MIYITCLTKEKTEPIKKQKDNQFGYKDTTKDYINNATPNSHELKIDKYFIDDDGIMHPIKGKEVVHITLKDSVEYKRSMWLKEIFGGEIHNVPRISDITNTGIKTATPDYRWNGEKWDLKIPTTKGKFKNTLERFLKAKKAKKQAKKYIIDYVNFLEKQMKKYKK